MSKYNLRCGMLLYCKDGQTVQLASFSDTHIRVVYKGKIHERPISVLNEKLFFVKSCEKITPADSRKIPKSLVNEHLNQPTDNGESVPTVETFLSTAKNEETWEKSCRNCKFQISGECSSWDLCDDYQPVYSIPKLETDYWPKYGDATLFKRKSRKK